MDNDYQQARIRISQKMVFMTHLASMNLHACKLPLQC